MFRAEDQLKYKYLPSERVNEISPRPERRVKKKGKVETQVKRNTGQSKDVGNGEYKQFMNVHLACPLVCM
jgi:hypothetical protein